MVKHDKTATVAATDEGAEAADEGAAPAGEAGQFIAVTGPAIGRWRIGRKFTPDPVRIELSTITIDEAKALASDPELRISRG